MAKVQKSLPHKQRIDYYTQKRQPKLPFYVGKLLLDDFQDLHRAGLDTNAAGDALGGGIFRLQDHDLHGAGLDTLAAGNTLLLVDHVNTGLGILGDSLMLTGLHALTALDANHGLGSSTLGNDLDAGQIGVKFLVERLRASLDTLQASHTFSILINSELLHIRELSFSNIFVLIIIHQLHSDCNGKMKILGIFSQKKQNGFLFLSSQPNFGNTIYELKSNRRNHP
jgi:hypothetical protein